MRKKRTALLLGILMALSLLLTGCRSAKEEVTAESHEVESFTENFNTPKPTPTPTPEGGVAEKLSTLDHVLSTATHFVLKKYKLEGVIFEERKKDERLVVSP